MSDNGWILTERPHVCNIKVWHGEDWVDPLPQLIDPVTGEPFDVTNVHFELFARPSLDHATRFALLASDSNNQILKDNAAEGLITIFYPQSDVEANLILSPTEGWRQFLRMTFDDDDLGEVTKILWTGKLIVLPAKDS